MLRSLRKREDARFRCCCCTTRRRKSPGSEALSLLPGSLACVFGTVWSNGPENEKAKLSGPALRHQRYSELEQDVCQVIVLVTVTNNLYGLKLTNPATCAMIVYNGCVGWVWTDVLRPL